MSIILFIIILAVLILAHEAGHFLAAKKSGIKVEEFGIGFPPRIFGWKKGETTYSVNWIPFGGFVRIFGETPDNDSITGPEAKRSLVHKNRGIQVLVLAAGVLCNFILAWLLLSVGFMFGLPTAVSGLPKDLSVSNVHPVVMEVVKDSPAEKAGLIVGDIVQGVKFGATTITEPDTTALKAFLVDKADKDIKFVVQKRNATTTTVLSVIPKIGVIGNQPAIGVSIEKIGLLKLSFFSAFWQGLQFTISNIWATLQGFYYLLSQVFHGNSVLNEIAGPVGMVSIVKNLAGLGWAYVLVFTAVISINLGVLNLIPFPALDGGRIVIVAIEAVIRRRVKPELVNWLNAFGFLLLIGLMLIVTFHDISKIF